MKFPIVLLTSLLLSTTIFAFEAFNSSQSLDIFNKIQCTDGTVCVKASDKVQITTYGALNEQVAATATTITSDQCGATFINTAAVVINLPEASAVLGCRLTFVVGHASNFDINPDDADQILTLTNAAGDAVRNATVGGSFVVEAISASQWSLIGAQTGTWTDIN